MNPATPSAPLRNTARSKVEPAPSKLHKANAISQSVALSVLVFYGLGTSASNVWAAPLEFAADNAPIATVVLGTREIETQVIAFPRATSPGSSLRLIYSVINYEEADIRVRLQPHLPTGWTLLNPEILDQEFTIEALDEIDGELLVVVAREAKVGDRQLVKLWAEVIGESGVYEGQNFVSIARTGGVKPGVVALTGSTTVGVSRVSRGMPDARTAGGFALSGKLDSKTTVTVSGGRDMAENLTNYRYNFEPVKVTGSVRRGNLDAFFGNIIFSSGNAITGPFVRGRGGSIRKLTGRFIGDLTITQPTTYSGDASGYLVRGRVGMSASFGSLSFVASDFSRPAGYTTLLPVVTVLDPDGAERQEIERRLAAGATSNRVFGSGVEGELRRQNVHRFSVRVGVLHLANAAGLTRTSPAGEAAYGYNGKAATLNARFRETPPGMQGVQIGGDERWLDGTVRVYKDLRFVAQGFRSAYDVTGGQYSSLSNGSSLGARIMRGSSRLEVRGNYRESSYNTKTIRRTGSLSAGLPVGPFSVNGNAEVGESDTARGVQPLAFYRADARLTRERGTGSLSMSQIKNGGLPAQQRFDILGSVKVGEYELSGGAWATRGYIVGGHPGVWTTAGVPTPFGLTAVLGMEYAPLTYVAEPGWRGSFMLRRPLVVPLGFLSKRQPAALPPQ
jgi:hypothetical protein